jgi:hypothetical protein
MLVFCKFFLNCFYNKRKKGYTFVIENIDYRGLRPIPRQINRF